MKILLLGKNGQVGWELQRALAPLGELIALDRIGQAGLVGDLSDLPGLANTVAACRPDVIVNAAAYTAVDKAESETELAKRINAEAPAVLAQAAQQCGALLVHYSTDYVFDGDGVRAWTETDQTGPLNVYGHSKLAGEQAIQGSGCRHLIFRTSWVYAARGGNFARTMLRLASERDQLAVIDDQRGAPTGAALIADVTAHAIRAASISADLAGLYHLAAQGETSWYGYAQFVLGYAQNAGVELRVAPDAVRPIPSSEYPVPARRPFNSRLNVSRLEQAFGLTMPPWQQGVEQMLDEILTS